MDAPLIEHIVTERGLLVLESEWRRLEPQMTQLPFVSFDWLIPWWKHLSVNKWLVRDELFVTTFRSREGTLLGIAPLMITHRPGFGPFQFRQLQFLGADPNLTEIRCIAAAPENTVMLYSALLDHLRELPKKWDSFNLSGLPENTPQLEARINDAYRTNYWTHNTVNPILQLKGTWEEFKAGLPRNIKESIRKCYNAPKRDGLTFEFQVASERRDVKSALGSFFELHRARANMDGSVMHRDNFSAARNQKFLLEVCDRFANRDALRIFQILHKDRVIATRIGFVLGDSLYLYYSGYDPEYKDYSVMTTVVVEAMKYAIAQGFRTVNLSTGRDVSKTRWAPTEVQYREVEFASPSPLHVLKHRGYRAVLRYMRQQRASNTWVSRTFSRGAG